MAEFWGWLPQNAPTPTTKHSHKPASPSRTTPPPPEGRRDSSPRRGGGRGGYFFSYEQSKRDRKETTPLPHDETEQQNNKHPPHPPAGNQNPPEAPCQANRKEGAGHNAPPARPLEPVPPQGQPPNQAGMFCLLFCCSVLLWGRGGGFFVAFLRQCVTENVYSLTACPAGGHFLVP